MVTDRLLASEPQGSVTTLVPDTPALRRYLTSPLLAITTVRGHLSDASAGVGKALPVLLEEPAYTILMLVRRHRRPCHPTHKSRDIPLAVDLSVAFDSCSAN